MNRSVLAIFISICFILFSCDDPPPPKATAKLGSRVELAAGEVQLVQGTKKTRLITGAMLEDNSSLTVGAGGRALIRLNSGIKVFLRENTVVQLAGDGLTLTSGELWADIPSAGAGDMAALKAGVVTVTAEDAGIDLMNDGKKVTVYAARGLALASGPGGREEVQSGERAVFAGNGAPQVEPVTFWEDWTGGLADRPLSVGSAGQGAGTLYGIDRMRPGSKPESLQITAQTISVTVRNGIAHTEVDQRFFNPSSTPLEGFYWFTVPEGASVHRFALEVNGSWVDGEMVERKQAAAAYEDAVQQAFDPALLEWVDGKSFRARIFPIPAAGERRVVLSYFETLPLADGVYRYIYPMAASDATVQEFSLTVDLGEDGEKFVPKTQEDAKVEADGSRVSIRRSGYRPQADFLLELLPKEEKSPLKVLRFAGRDNEADYIMLRYSPEVDWQKLSKVVGDVVVVLDTSAGGDDADRQVRQDTMEAILRSLSDDDRFAVVTADLVPKVIYPEKGLAAANEQNVSRAVEKLAEVASAGATDLGAMFSSALNLLHGTRQPAVVYVGDGNATVGETTSDALADRLRRSLGESRARLFTIAVGEDANVPMLERLARLGGGRSFVISDSAQTVQEALRFVGMLKTPTLTNLQIDAGKGLDQVFQSAAGKISEGDEIILLARTHHALPSAIKMSGKLGDTPFEKTYEVQEEKGANPGFIPTLWARQYLFELMRSGLEENRGRIIALGLNYSLMTPFTSFLVLESDAAYMQQGIQRRNRYQFSALGIKKKETGFAATELLSIPLGLMGCAAEAEPPIPEAMTPSQMQSAPPITAATGADMNRTVSPSPSSPPASERMEEGAATAIGGMKKKGGGASDEILAAQPARRASSPPKSPGSDDGFKGGRDAKMDEMDDLLAANPKEEARSPAVDGNDFFAAEICSDASRRPLRERRMLWQRRLTMAPDASQYYGVFVQAGKACELPAWRDRKAMLDLIDAQVHKADDVPILLASFSAIPSAARYLRNRILRRAFDPDQLLGDTPGETYWPAFRAGLLAMKSPDEREKMLRGFLENNPAQMQAREMLAFLLAAQNKTEEAKKEAIRVRRDGAASPKILELLCDLQAGDREVVAARRTCSELVEFNPNDPKAHERLGDMFLRHGWYQEAYRQYTGLVEMMKDVPAALLRLAAAAAGMGKVDEALRIERKVASGDGEAGPNDPRRIARLHSAARLAALLVTARQDKKTDATAVERNLKRTQVFQTKTTLAFVIWEDYQAVLAVTPQRDGLAYTPVETVSASASGLIMLDLGRDPPNNIVFEIAQNSATLHRPVPYTLFIVTFDGQTFQIEERKDTAQAPKTV